jgi:hypothetical protein
MRSIIETAVLITGCASAICWFASAMWHLPRIKPAGDEMAKVSELSDRLQRIGRWNFWAAGLMGVTALLSVWGRLLA